MGADSPDSEQSKIQLRVGGNEVIIEGSEEFISSQTEVILDRVDLTSAPVLREAISNQNEAGGVSEQNGSDSSEQADLDVSYHELIEEAAEYLGVTASKVGGEFYVDGDTIHIKHPRSIPERHALIGYCVIKGLRKSEPFFDNKGTKDKIIEKERVPISSWGGILRDLRREGLIKDNPNTSRKRNKPFKITPQAEQRFVNWLKEES